MQKRLNSLLVKLLLPDAKAPVRCTVYVDGIQAAEPVHIEGVSETVLEAQGDWPLGSHTFTVLRLPGSAEDPSGSNITVTEASINGQAIVMVPFTMVGDGQSPPVGFTIQEHGFSVAAEITALHEKLDWLMAFLTRTVVGGAGAALVDGLEKALPSSASNDTGDGQGDGQGDVGGSDPAAVSPEPGAPETAAAAENPAAAAPTPPVAEAAPQPPAEPAPAATEPAPAPEQPAAAA